jgi:hypothetical protein
MRWPSIVAPKSASIPAQAASLLSKMKLIDFEFPLDEYGHSANRTFAKISGNRLLRVFPLFESGKFATCTTGRSCHESQTVST